MLFLLILIISLVLQLFLPWWIIAIVAFVLCMIKAKTGGQAFGLSFASIFILWSVVALYKSLVNDNVLASRVGELLMLKMDNNWILVILATALIGGLVAAFAGMAGYYTRSTFLK